MFSFTFIITALGVVGLVALSLLNLCTLRRVERKVGAFAGLTPAELAELTSRFRAASERLEALAGDESRKPSKP